MWYVHTTKYYSDVKDEILPFLTIWMNPENITLSKISQKEKKNHDFTNMWDTKQKATNEGTKETKKLSSIQTTV